jgi:sulfate permease, SulP family
MARTDVVNGSRRSATDNVAEILKDVFAGSISSILSIAYGLSFAALIFSGPLTPWLAYGIAATFIATAAGALVVAARSSIPFMIAGPDGSTAAVTASLAAATVAPLAASGADDLLTPALFVLALSAGLTGILLCTLGFAGAGGAIRFVPYPVIGGFLGATGWLMASGAVRVMTGAELSLAGAEALLAAPNIGKLGAGLAVALALYLGLRRPRSPFLLPGLLLAGVAAAHLAMTLTGTMLAEAQAAGWMFSTPERVPLTTPWTAAGFLDLPWHALPRLSGDLFAVMFVTAVTMLLNTTGIEFVTRREANLERELTTLGTANILSSGLGGYVNCSSLSRTTLNFTAGGRGRLCGLTVGVVAAMMLVANPGFIALIPKFVLGGLLLYLGLNLLTAWVVNSAWRLSRLEYLSLLAIALIIVQWGFIAGVLIGVIIGCATFAVSASRVSAIKFRFDGSEYRSTLDRGHDELMVLAAHGHEIQGMSLQSYLFFGSANRLYRQVKALLHEQPSCRFLLFDFRLVTGIDSSAMHSFTQIKQAADEAGTRLILVNLPAGLEAVFRTHGIVTDDVRVTSDFDRALETCERAVIRRYLPEAGASRSLRAWLAEDLGSADLADDLIAHCREMRVNKGDIIARQGDPADCMHFILEGRVAVIVRLRNGKAMRVRSLGFHTTIGEMGLITHQNRSATIMAEADSVLYALGIEAYERITASNPALSQALLTYVIGVMTDRLNFASKTMGVLRR